MKKIKVYSTAVCPYCVTLKSFLMEHNFKFEDIDVGADKAAAEEMIAKSNQMGVPVVEIDGEVIVGFNKEKISQLLDIRD